MGKILKIIENENQNLVCAIILHWRAEIRGCETQFYQKQTKMNT